MFLSPFPRLLLCDCFAPLTSTQVAAVQCRDYSYPHPAEVDSNAPIPRHQCGPCPPTKRLQGSGAFPQGPEPAQSCQVGYQPAAIIHTTGIKRGDSCSYMIIPCVLPCAIDVMMETCCNKLPHPTTEQHSCSRPILGLNDTPVVAPS